MDIGKNILLKILPLFFLMSSGAFSQKKIIKKFTTNTKEIAIFTKGLDDLVLENSTSEFIEILLYACTHKILFIFFRKLQDRFFVKSLLITKSNETNPFSIISSLYKEALFVLSSGEPKENILSDE